MDAWMQQHARNAVARLDHVLDRGPEVEHAEIQAAVSAVVSFRNRAIEEHSRGAVSAACVDQANSLTSLAYGAEFPLSGLHHKRFEMARDGMRKLLDSA